MTRCLFNLLSALSLLLCVAVSVLWVRGYWVGDQITVSWPERSVPEKPPELKWVTRKQTLHSAKGRAMLYRSYGHGRGAASGTAGIKWTHPPPHRAIAMFGFVTNVKAFGPIYWASYKRSTSGDHSAARASDPYYQVQQGVEVPHWLLVMTTAPLPLAWAAAAAATRFRRCPGLCPCCGYDLRASPERCPECGERSKPVADRSG